MQHNVLHLQVIQKVLAQLGNSQPLLLTLPCHFLPCGSTSSSQVRKLRHGCQQAHMSTGAGMCWKPVHTYQELEFAVGNGKRLCWDSCVLLGDVPDVLSCVDGIRTRPGLFAAYRAFQHEPGHACHIQGCNIVNTHIQSDLTTPTDHTSTSSAHGCYLLSNMANSCDSAGLLGALSLLPP